jgi:O-antigen ligase
MLPSVLVKGGNLSFFDYPARALLFVPVVLGLRARADRLSISRGFFLGASAGGLGGACFSLYSLLLYPGARVGFPIANPIPFGQIATLLALIAFASIFNTSRHWERLLSVFGFLGATFTIYATGSYGPLLGFGFGLSVLFAFVLRRRFSRFTYFGLFLLLSVVLLICAPLLIPKFIQITSDVQAYASGSGMGASQGQRLILWSISLHEIANSPFLGIGPGHLKSVLLDFCEVNRCIGDFSTFNQVHNQYFDSALNAGLIGLTGLLVTIFSPAVLFYRRLSSPSAQVQNASATGLAIVVAASVSMVSQCLFAHNISVIPFFLTISVCWFLASPLAMEA